jgi:hypothetical protein
MTSTFEMRTLFYCKGAFMHSLANIGVLGFPVGFQSYEMLPGNNTEVVYSVIIWQ